MESMPGHHHHDEPEKLGQVSFPTSCSPQSQPAMERGVALLHSFGYTEAQEQFEAIAKADPACAMAHWGVAMTQFQPLWGLPSDAQLKRGFSEMAQARQLAKSPAKITPREQAYIDAMSAYFALGTPTYEKRAAAYESKMNALHAANPDDVEGAAFDALAILADVPPGDSSLTYERRALAILVPLFAAHPDHPGLAHYIIHTCDTPALAQDGLAAAREYAKIAPSSAHALHMPGHIFARLGMWQEDIDSNLASVRASEKAEAAHLPGAAHQMHAQEFLVYAWLQVGEDEKAHALVEQMPSIGARMAAMSGMDDMKNEGAFLSNELNAIYAIEMRDWKTAAALKPVAGSAAVDTPDIFWANGMAAAHFHDAALASEALRGFEHNFDAKLMGSLDTYVLNIIQTQHTELRAWQAYAENKPEEAVALIRKAADFQDRKGQAEVDIPARELLGDLLLMEHKPAEALAEYKVALKLSPNRLNGLLSAAQAAEESGHAAEALEFRKVAAAQTNNAANSKRPELARAVQAAQGVSK